MMIDHTYEDAMRELTDIGQKIEEAKDEYEVQNDAWWNGLSEQEREDAFYAVCKRIYDGEIKQKGSYRYILYNIFGFGPGMYLQGMNCGFMCIHNAIVDYDNE
jgi:hypothetical protein